MCSMSARLCLKEQPGERSKRTNPTGGEHEGETPKLGYVFLKSGLRLSAGLRHHNSWRRLFGYRKQFLRVVRLERCTVGMKIMRGETFNKQQS